jgi:hypothetical protein
MTGTEANPTTAQLERRVIWQTTRRQAQAFADAHGYFWLPCPTCGTPFGGQEWLTGNESGNQAICPVCAYEQGEAAEAQCESVGHNLQDRTVSRPVKIKPPGLFRSIGKILMGNPVAHTYCQRCKLRFDSRTKQPIGRPLPDPSSHNRDLG